MHAHGGDVAADGRHLRFLERRHLASGVEHDDARAGHPGESARDGAARVAGGRHEHRGVVSLVAQDFAEEPSEEPRAEVLEGQRGPVKQLQQQQAIVERSQRNGEIQRVDDDAVDHAGRELALEQGVRQALRQGGERQAAPRREIAGVDARERFGQVQAAIRRQALADRGAQASGGRAAVRAGQSHVTPGCVRRCG